MEKRLTHAYEVFQVDSGLGGNIFTQNITHLSKLSTEHWFYDLWRLCTHLCVSLTVQEENNTPLARDGDSALMECFIHLGIFNVNQLCVLGRY